MATQSSAASRSYVNVLPTSTNGNILVDHKNAPIGKPVHSYINIPLKTPAEDGEQNCKSEEESIANGLVRNGLGGPAAPSNPPLSGSIDIPTSTGDSGQRHHASLNDGRYNLVSPSRVTSSFAQDTVADAKLKLLMPGQSGGCENCDELSRLLAMWEIGVSGLTRNYSRILAHLIKIRNASMALEFRLTESAQPAKNVATPQSSLTPPLPRVTKNRQSMFVNNGSSAVTAAIRDHDIAENMYPNRKATAETATQQPPPTSSPPYTGDLKDLNSHLEEAIDLCQQLAAACFKTNHLTELAGMNASPSSFRSASSIRHDAANMRKHSAGASPSGNMYKPSMQSIAEIRLTGSGRKKRTLERVPSAPDLELSGEMLSSGGSSDFESSFVKISKDEVPDSVTKSSPNVNSGRQQSHGTVKGVAIEGEEPGVSMEGKESQDLNNGLPTDIGGSFSSGMGVSLMSDQSGMGASLMSDRPVSSISTYSDSDVKCVMSKIASLEEERYKLLETINALQEDNGVVRLSLQEILGDLENKDLQLMLAMQDLTIATGEIKIATIMRKKLDALSTERDLLLEKLCDLEDESAAVKVSLIQLLQQKSATNKTLALENFRLSQRVRTSTGDSPAAVTVGSGDNVSIRSGYSVTTEDNTMQEAYMGADMGENFVHKQGFLVKQGGKVKSWKKRLFVLNTDGLSYYKTEQPIQTIPIERIDKVVICHGNCSQPHMFRVHTQGRTFLLSASSADEMQSWVGMLETLKQYKKTAALHREATLRVQILQASAPLPESQDQAPPKATPLKATPLKATPLKANAPSPASPGSDVVIISSPERDSLSPAPEGKASEEEEEEEEHLILHQEIEEGTQHHMQVASEGELDDDDDTTYLQDFTPGSVPTYLSKGAGSIAEQPDLLASLDLHNM